LKRGVDITPVQLFSDNTKQFYTGAPGALRSALAQPKLQLSAGLEWPEGVANQLIQSFGPSNLKLWLDTVSGKGVS
jgi:hypothetical protein